MAMNINSLSGTNSPFNNMNNTSQPTITAAKAVEPDSVQLGTIEPKQKTGIVQKTKDFFRTAKKFFATAGGYTGATFKGAGQGFLVGSSVFTAGSIINAFKGHSVAKAAKSGIEKAVKKLPVKFLAVGAAIATLAVNYWKASLDINQKRSEIDLRWKNTPVNN